MGLRESKRKATRDQLARAALQLTLERGASATTIEDIARLANVAPRTLSNHFVSKEAAILGISRDSPSEMAKRLLARPPAEAPLEALMQATFRRGSGASPRSMRIRAELVRLDPSLNEAYVGSFSALYLAVTPAMATRLGLDPVTDLFPSVVVSVGLTTMRVLVHHLLERWPWPEHFTEEQVRDQLLTEMRQTLTALDVSLRPLAPPSMSDIARV